MEPGLLAVFEQPRVNLEYDGEWRLEPLLAPLSNAVFVRHALLLANVGECTTLEEIAGLRYPGTPISLLVPGQVMADGSVYGDVTDEEWEALSPAKSLVKGDQEPQILLAIGPDRVKTVLRAESLTALEADLRSLLALLLTQERSHVFHGAHLKRRLGQLSVPRVVVENSISPTLMHADCGGSGTITVSTQFLRRITEAIIKEAMDGGYGIYGEVASAAVTLWDDDDERRPSWPLYSGSLPLHLAGLVELQNERAAYYAYRPADYLIDAYMRGVALVRDFEHDIKPAVASALRAEGSAGTLGPETEPELARWAFGPDSPPVEPAGSVLGLRLSVWRTASTAGWKLDDERSAETGSNGTEIPALIPRMRLLALDDATRLRLKELETRLETLHIAHEEIGDKASEDGEFERMQGFTKQAIRAMGLRTLVLYIEQEYRKVLVFALGHEAAHIWIDGCVEPLTVETESAADAFGALAGIELFSNYYYDNSLTNVVRSMASGGPVAGRETDLRSQLGSELVGRPGIALIRDAFGPGGVPGDTEHGKLSVRDDEVRKAYAKMIADSIRRTK